MDKKISKANERRGKVKGGKDEEVNRQGEKRGAPGKTEQKDRTQIIIRQPVAYSLQANTLHYSPLRKTVFLHKGNTKHKMLTFTL